MNELQNMMSQLGGGVQEKPLLVHIPNPRLQEKRGNTVRCFCVICNSAHHLVEAQARRG